MSFYIGNNRSERTPGVIHGNPTHGLCERICIQTNKVFDACLQQTQLDDQPITLTGFSPETFTPPLTFVSGQNRAGQPFTVSNLIVDRLEDRPNFARVSATVTIPVDVIWTAANGVSGTAQGTVSVNEDVVLYVPQASIVPYTVEAFGGVILTDGRFTGDTTEFTADVCLALILKIVAVSDILIPTYGYCLIPPCQSFSEDVCSGFFDLPLFPTPILPDRQTTNDAI